MISRSLVLPARPETSFFLWGPRQTGKTSLLRSTYPDALWIDLLKTDLFVRYSTEPHLLREQLLAETDPRVVVLDEVQKIPPLLDEVHWLIENTKHVFALCGSSARKVRRGAANLLGGRATRYELFGLVSAEIGRTFDPVRTLNHGYLPRHHLSDRPAALVRAYVDDYLKEEVAAEGLVRSLPTFAGFLRAAAISDTQMVNYSTIARECGISSPAVKEYFQILVDTLLGRYLPAYTRRPKRRVIQSPKFYFADVGIVNHLTRRGRLTPGSELFGKAFENWIFHELSGHRAYSEEFYDLSYWRLPSGIEADFVVNDMECVIEAKASSRITADHLRGLREVAVDHRRVKRRILVCLEERARRTEDGIDILPAREFVRRLWAGDVTR